MPAYLTLCISELHNNRSMCNHRLYLALVRGRYQLGKQHSVLGTSFETVSEHDDSRQVLMHISTRPAGFAPTYGMHRVTMLGNWVCLRQHVSESHTRLLSPGWLTYSGHGNRSCCHLWLYRIYNNIIYKIHVAMARCSGMHPCLRSSWLHCCSA